MDRSDGPSNFFGSYSKYKHRSRMASHTFPDHAWLRSALAECLEDPSMVCLDVEDAMSLLLLQDTVDNMPPPPGLPSGKWEQYLAEMMHDAWGPAIPLREALGGAAESREYVYHPPPATAAEAARFLRQSIRELTLFRTQCSPAGKSEWEFCQENVRTTRNRILETLKERPGYARCPTCRFEHSFWRKSEKKSECPVCFEPADGVVAPCSHGLCKSCFCNVKKVPISISEKGVLAITSLPAHREWAARHNA